MRATVRAAILVLLLLLLLLILQSLVIASEGAICQTVVSGDSVQTLSPFFLGVSPKPIKCGFGGCAPYISQVSCLSISGPLGAYGPLGALGPLGTNSWSSVHYWFDVVGDWSDFSKKYTGMGGPLSKEGPLGSNGPLGNSYYTVMPNINDFAKHMQANGIWSVLGPLGPLGALGPLGPLGPIGTHGYGKSSGGDWVDTNNQIVRTITVDYDGSSTRTYGLFERYTSERAKALGWDQDTSFMTTSKVTPTGGGGDVFRLTSTESQWVTVVVVPQNYLDNFKLEILDENGQSIVTSSGMMTINWAQLHIPNGPKRLQIRVKLGSSISMLDHYYFLYVVGSTQYIQKDIDFQGKYILNC